MKIAVVGFVKLENFGDQFITKCVEYLVRQYGKVDTVVCDITTTGVGNRKNLFPRGIHKLTKLLKIKEFGYKVCLWKYKACYKHGLFKELDKVDAIIFSTGSFKYGTQELWAQYSTIVEYANKKNIPVMFDAMNVQKYNANDFRCLYLKKHLNMNCVKYFTTRDGDFGVQRIKQDYLENSELKVLPVGDTAFWIPEVYKIRRKEKTDLIGVNVIAPDRFIVYGGELEPAAVKNAYLEFIHLLTINNYSWQLFTNGMEDDNIFAKELINSLDEDPQRLVIPKSDSDLVELESGYTAVFGARLHSMICAYSFGIPVAGFIWDEKILHFAEMARIEKYFLKEKEVSGKAMFDVLLKALDSKDDRNNRLFWKNKTKESIFEFLKSIKSI